MTKSSLLRSDSERKFTPPTKFPAEYVDGHGNKVTILGRSHHKGYPYIGYRVNGSPHSWTEGGREYANMAMSKSDLHDIPKRITTWHNVYADHLSTVKNSRAESDVYRRGGRLCVYRIERDEDGGNPEIFVEDV